MSGPHDRLRLLYLQHCPESVISNLLGRAAVFWTLEGQAALLQVVTCADAQALDPRYRKQILSRIVQFSASLPSLRQSSEGAAQHDQFVAALTSCRNDKANRYTSWSRSWACWQYMLTPTATVTVRARNKLGSEPGECVWDSAVALSAWLVSQPADSLQGRHAIELGAGTGLVGCVLARYVSLGSLALTDSVPEVLDILRYNCSVNCPSDEPVCVRRLDWEDPDESQGLAPVPDLILGADLVYDPALVLPLVRTLARLLVACAPGGVALIAGERREPAWSLFMAAVAEHGLAVQERSAEVRAELGRETCPFWCSVDTIERVMLLELSLPASSAATNPLLVDLRPHQQAPTAGSAAVESLEKQVFAASLSNTEDSPQPATVDTPASVTLSSLTVDVLLLLCAAVPLEHHPILRATCRQLRELVDCESGARKSVPAVGSRVGLSGLTGRPELNGLRGFVVSWDAGTMRFGVKLDDARMLSVQRANLQVVWGKLEAHVSWVARVTRAPRIIRPQLWIDLVREVGSDFMIFSDLFFEPEAFAMLQYAVEAQVVHWFAMQQALLHHRRSSQESGCVVLESTAQCIPPDDACLRESGRWAAGPIAIGQVPQESDNWWMPRAVVLVPNTPTASALVWQDQALVRPWRVDHALEGQGGACRAPPVLGSNTGPGLPRRTGPSLRV